MPNEDQMQRQTSIVVKDAKLRMSLKKKNRDVALAGKKLMLSHD